MPCWLLGSNRRLSVHVSYGQLSLPAMLTTAQPPTRPPAHAVSLQTIQPTPGQPTKDPVLIPVRMGLLGPDGKEVPLKLRG